MSQSVAGRVMPMIVVRSVDAIRNFYVDTLGFTHVMGMVGKDGQLDFCTVVMGEARIMFMRAPGDAHPTRARRDPPHLAGRAAAHNHHQITPDPPRRRNRRAHRPLPTHR